MTKKTTGSKKGKTTKTRSAPKAAAGKKDAAWASFAAELKSLIPELDSEGLAFLVQQARVHLYNMHVDKLNQATIAADLASIKAQTASRSRRERAVQKPAGVFKIKGTQNGSYYIYYGHDNAIFSGDEMGRIVNIVYSEGSDLEVRERLFNWFKRERSDFFAVAPIPDKFDERLKALTALIIKSFKMPRRRG